MACAEPITRAEAQAEFGRLVNEQVAAFTAQQQQTAALNANTRILIDQLRAEAQAALVSNKAAADEQVATLREDARQAITTLDNKTSVVDKSLSLHAVSQAAFEQKMADLEAGIHQFADEARASIRQIQAGIPAIVAEARSSDGTSSFRPSQERDRQVFDPRDYKIELGPSHLSLAVWKKWRHEVEIYIVTIGPSWRGVTFLQQARHSETPLVELQTSMAVTVGRAIAAAGGVFLFDPVLFDYAGKAAIYIAC